MGAGAVVTLVVDVHHRFPVHGRDQAGVQPIRWFKRFQRVDAELLFMSRHYFSDRALRTSFKA